MKDIRPRIRRVLQGSDADFALIMNTSYHDSNFTYLTGIYSGSFEGSVVIAEGESAKLITTQLDYGVAKDNPAKGLEVVCVNSRDEMLKNLKELKGKIVGINGNFLPYGAYNRLKKDILPKKIIDISGRFISARQVKEWDEIELIGIANNIVKKALSQIEGEFFSGMTEKELAKTFDSMMLDYGASSPSFETIVCFGANSAVPHHVPDNTKLSNNSFVLIDAGARYRGYCSDVTRTFIFKPEKKGSKYRKMLDIYNTVDAAQKAALERAVPDAYADTVHIAASDYINKAKGGMYAGKFTHALGHSVGIDVHDGPGFSPLSHYKLKERMVISNEPGIYIDGFGGVRIEDDLLILKKGSKYL
jgi:Xaa-Pro dipeptidase